MREELKIKNEVVFRNIENFNTLVRTGSVTVEGVTYEYSPEDTIYYVLMNSEYVTPEALETVLETKQNKLTAGSGITIDDDVISSDVDLSDYATKQEVTSGLSEKQNELTAGVGISIVNDVISATLGITFEVVQSLPASGAEQTIYLVSNIGTSPNIYDEYIWVNNAFEKIGTTDIDLSGYVTLTALAQMLTDYVTASSLTNTLADYITATALSTALADYMTAQEISHTLDDFVMRDDMTSVTRLAMLTNNGATITRFNEPNFDNAQNGVLIRAGNVAANISVKTNGNVKNSRIYVDSKVDELLAGKQGTLTAGAGISIINDVISATLGVTFDVVQELPATGAPQTIYLVPNSGENPNIYDEYIWVNNGYEKIGTTDIDLTDYATWTELEPIFNDYVLWLELDEELAKYATSSAMNEALSVKVDDDKAATSSELGLVKLNPNESIDMNADGQLTVGGRVGQFSSQEVPTGGLYYPTTIQPEMVKENSFLITEGTKISADNKRILALAAGIGVTLKTSAAAGATTFQVSNTFANRFNCAIARGGYATIDEASAGTIMVKVLSVTTANDPTTELVPYTGATESNNNIIITTDAPLSDTEAITKLRLYGSMTFDSSFFCGQGNGTGGVTGKGKVLMLGQGELSLDGNSILVGNGIFNSKNRCALFGSQLINHQQSAFMAGELHDNINGKKGVAAVGSASIIKPTTAFVIGNGTAYNDRSNIFEVADNNGQTEVIMKSPNGTEYKLSVDDSGNLSVSAV